MDYSWAHKPLSDQNGSAVHPNIDPLCFGERLTKYNQDFEVLQKLEESNLDFSVVEINELRALLGLYGGETEKRLPPGYMRVEYVGQQQLYWGRKVAQIPYGTTEYAVASKRTPATA